MLAIGCHRPSASTAQQVPTIEYQGQQIRLSRAYADFEDYKEDPGNLAPDEIPRVQQLVKSGTVPEHCADLDCVLHSTMALEFPGYGFGDLGELHTDDGRPVVMARAIA